jgi:hypothetical protein
MQLDMSADFNLLDKSILMQKLRARWFPEKVIANFNDFVW